MKFKGLVALILMLTLLLAGCKRPEVPVVQPTYDEVPQVAERTVYINGTRIESVYQQKGFFYVEANAMAAAFGGTAEVIPGVEEHKAILKIAGKEYAFTSYKAPQTTENIYCYKGSLYDGEKFYCPIESLKDYFGLTETQDQTQVQVYYYGTAPVPQSVPEGVEVPVLMYHAVSDNMWGIESLFVKPSRMEEQLKWLTENGYTPIWFEDLNRLGEIEKPIILTFDDGYDDNYTELFPLLKKYQVKATVFMITGSIGKEHYLTEAQIREMAASGLISVQSHTVSHPMLPELNAEQLKTELTESKRKILELTGKEPFVFCYPTGKYNKMVKEAVKEEYQYALLMSGNDWVTGEDPLLIHREYISRSTTLNQFKSMIK